MSAMPDVIPVRVCVRCRPFNTREKNEKATQCLQFFKKENQLSCNSKMFSFDSVLDPSTDQQQAYEATVHSLLDSFLNGFNCTILAYGQTGSGKTYTMGTAETAAGIVSDSRGIVPRFVEDLFSKIKDLNSEIKNYTVTVSMLEIYDEKIRDLLSTGERDKEGLQAREISGVVTIPGLSIRAVANLQDTMAALEEGCQQRSMGETAMNAVSSRSHAIFRIDLEKTSLSDEAGPSFKAKLHLVDLAGSERIKKTQAEGTRLKEGIRINEGLLALGNVISALSEPGGNNRHIPYRDSKITRLLQDSLGGNSHTVMIACISPADTNAEETLSTLRYADRAKKIKNKPVVIVDHDKDIIKQLREQIGQLQREIGELRGGVTTDVNATNTTDSAELLHLKEELAEKERLLSIEGNKAAEAIIQKSNVTRRLIKLEEDRERLSSLIREVERGEVTTLFKQIEDILEGHIEECHHDSIDSETATATCDENEDVENEEDLSEKAMKYANQHNKLDNDLEELMNQIKNREEAIKRVGEDKDNYLKLLKEQENETAALQQKIDSLTTLIVEKETEWKKQTIGNKLAEERRKKLLEMDKQLQQYKKQMSDLKRVESQKVQCEESMKKMGKEIQELKQVRVKMMKQMKMEASKYLECKSKMERQVAQLKAKERKREGEIARETRANDMKVAILKQKLEDSRKLAKRLETQRGRAAANVNDIQINDEKSFKVIKSLLTEELNLLGSSYEAELMCATLKEQRKQINMKINRLRKNDEPATKKRKDSEGNTLLDSENSTIKEIEALETQQDVCTSELKTLQEGCTKVDPDRIFELIKEKNVHTVSSASKINRIVLEMLVNEKKNSVELQAEIKSYKQKLTEAERTIREQKQAQKKALASMSEIEKSTALDFNRKLDDVLEKYSNLLTVWNYRKENEPKEIQDGIENAVQMIAEMRAPVRNRKKTSDVAAVPIPPKRSRVLRNRPEFFGDVRDTVEAVVVDENDPNVTRDGGPDISYYPSEASRKSKKKPIDFSPIKGVDPASEHDRRRSRFVTQETVKLEIEQDNIVESPTMNATFVKSNSPNSELEQLRSMRPLRVTKFNSPSLGERPSV